jgi:ribokinase
MQGGARIICNFGSDGHGATLRDAVSSAGVDTSLCTRVDKPSGQAFILLQADGDNSIILTAGSNAAWPQQLPLHCASAIASCSILLLQR